MSYLPDVDMAMRVSLPPQKIPGSETAEHPSVT